mmetsp:Transcript_71486/g.83158  ORF Transcript_71486/g.83158 Transcript_71486/m.83158 type:complete len:90 (-) Transcript_71486:20-289(-)
MTMKITIKMTVKITMNMTVTITMKITKKRVKTTMNMTVFHLQIPVSRVEIVTDVISMDIGGGIVLNPTLITVYAVENLVKCGGLVRMGV